MLDCDVKKVENSLDFFYRIELQIFVPHHQEWVSRLSLYDVIGDHAFPFLGLLANDVFPLWVLSCMVNRRTKTLLIIIVYIQHEAGQSDNCSKVLLHVYATITIHNRGYEQNEHGSSSQLHCSPPTICTRWTQQALCWNMHYF